jgi:hypothetical protein
MINATRMTRLGSSLRKWNEEDVSRYGTIWVLLACAGVVAILFFAG